MVRYILGISSLSSKFGLGRSVVPGLVPLGIRSPHHTSLCCRSVSMPLLHCTYFAPACLLIFAVLVSEAASHDVQVQIPGLGFLRGNLNRTLWTRRPVYQFRGIPFGKPPSGPRRFKVTSAFIVYICTPQENTASPRFTLKRNIDQKGIE